MKDCSGSNHGSSIRARRCRRDPSLSAQTADGQRLKSMVAFNERVLEATVDGRSINSSAAAELLRMEVRSRSMIGWSRS